MIVCQGNAFKVMEDFRLLVPAKKSKKATPIAQSEVTRNSEKNLTTHSTKNSYSLMKTCSDLQKQKHLNPEIINAAKKIHDMFTDDDIEIYEKAVEKMVILGKYNQF